jgi:hypothetical protein
MTLIRKTVQKKQRGRALKEILTPLELSYHVLLENPIYKSIQRTEEGI